MSVKSQKYNERAHTQYVGEKIRMLTDDFFIRLSDEDIVYIRSLKNKVDVDKHVHQLLIDRL